MNKHLLLAAIGFTLFIVFLPVQLVHAESGDYIQEMVEIRDGGSLDEQEAEAVITALSQVDVILIEQLYHYNVEIVLTEMDFIELDEVEEFNRADGRTLEDMAGFYDPGTKVIYVQLGQENDSAKAAVHELGHALDYFMSGNDTLPYTYYIQDEIDALIEQEKQAVVPFDMGLFGFTDFAEEEELRDDIPEGTGHYDQGDEYFAETFAYYYMGGEQQELLRENGPVTYAFIESIPNRILTPTTYDADEITISWISDEAVASYEIYLDEEQIDTIDSGISEYTIAHEELGETGYSDYQFSFKALDAAGNELMTSSIADTRNIPADISELEILVAEAEEMQERVHDDLAYIEDRLSFVYPVIEDYYDEAPGVRESINQSTVVSYEVYLQEIIQWFESDESYGESAERKNAAAGITNEDTEKTQSQYITPVVLGAIGLVLIVGVIIFVRRSKKHKE